ncbi:hypothetical protein TD95_002463 [Thielaviopsis punctulata]|uniref:F-box domain-containing protein n=1 Tax=Thielaviopsis punctulata TaxID=72032 RepID=A0A0F4Z9T6_9PEZI|nr:hypothetical protein TD95_002463 [Thielaviopsis punctulata]
MRFFRRKKDKKQKPYMDVPVFGHIRAGDGSYDSRFMVRYSCEPTRNSPRLLANFPPALLDRIFSFVCPQTIDESYDPCEQSAVGDTCPLCDLRDLAHATMVCKRWHYYGVQTLYRSIRIDNVHYCQREAVLAEKRKRKTFFDRNADPEDTAAARLKLLSRTLRDDQVRLAKLVTFFKIPYMLRESSQNDLSRTLAVLPNIKYVDLPEGLFSDDPAFSTLRLEVEARCPDLRKMTYMAGSEQSLSRLAYGSIWPNLEVLELTRISLDSFMLRHIISSLSNLRALKITDCKNFTDDVFAASENLPPLPAIQELILHKVPMTSFGFASLMVRPEIQNSLHILNLWRTGIKPVNLQDVFTAAPNLKNLAIHESVSQGIMSGANLPKLVSRSLETIRYEISSSSDSGAMSNASTSYYTYLASSILSGGLPKLHAVYVRDPYFPDHLMGLPPPPPSIPGLVRPRSSASLRGSPMTSPASSIGPASPQPHHATLPLPLPRPPPIGGAAQESNRFSSNNPFAGLGPLTKTLEVFTKSDDSMDWSFIKVAPQPMAGLSSRRMGSHARSVSSYGLGTDVAGLGWDSSHARRSVMVGHANGGGFLALPQEDETIPLPLPSPRFMQEGEAWPRPRSSGMAPSRGSKDLWS